VPRTERPIEGEGEGAGAYRQAVPHLVTEQVLVEDLVHGPREHQLGEALGPPPPQRVPGSVLHRRRRLAPLLLLVLAAPVEGGARGVAAILVAVAGVARAPHSAPRLDAAHEGRTGEVETTSRSFAIGGGFGDGLLVSAGDQSQ
jgi:hypothetical protein